MANVVVVGGGVAGLAAASAAARSGAKTTLVESSKRVGLSRASMPLLLMSEGWAEEDLVLPQAESLFQAGVEVRIGETVVSVDHRERRIRFSSSSSRPNGADHRDGAGIRFDSVVICTGAASQVPPLRGLSKPNVFVLREPADYLKLSTEVDALKTIVVTGPIPLALKVGEVLAARGKRALIYCGKEGLAHQFSEAVAVAIRRKAAEAFGGKRKKGAVTLVDDSVDSVLGVQRAEAIASGGSVQTCDGVVVIPRSVPVVPAVECERGRSGGLLVDASMSTSLRGVFAAGDSAEIRFKSGSVPARLYSTSRVGGEVAGINAAGGKATAAPSWAVEQTYFGLEFCSAGLSEAEASAMGLDAATEATESKKVLLGLGGGRKPRKTLVSIVFDTATHQVYGLQTAGWRASSLSAAASLIVSAGLTVEQLAHVESPYSPGSSFEVSPIALTASRILNAKEA
jgi:NADPH-dependent 2,4-dienoyl-CoA reductase/sulfur reductase-like enzyme